MYKIYYRLILIAIGSSILGACGATVPVIKEAWDKDIPGDAASNTPPVSGTTQIEFEVKKRIYCDLKKAVRTANQYAITEANGKKIINKSSLIPSNWGAQLSLLLEADESSSLNPGLALNTPMPAATSFFKGLPSVITPQSFTLGFGGNISSTASRVDKFNPFYTIEYLSLPEKQDSVCHEENDPFTRLGLQHAASSPLIIESDLGITDWLVGAMFTNRLIPSVSEPLKKPKVAKPRPGAQMQPAPQGQGSPSPKPDTVSIEIKFIIASTGNVTPTWKLVRVSANTGTTPFFSTGRTRTHDLIITIGPQTQQTDQQSQALQIGQAVGSSNRSTLINP